MVKKKLSADERDESKDGVNSDKPDPGTKELTVDNLREFEAGLRDISNDPTSDM